MGETRLYRTNNKNTKIMNQNDQTKALHVGHETKNTEGTRAVPIYQTTSYVFNDSDHAANLFSLAEPG